DIPPRPHLRASELRRADRRRARLGDPPPVVREDRVHRDAGREWNAPDGARQGCCECRRAGALRATHPGNVRRRHRRGAGGQARARRLRARRHGPRDLRREPPRLSHPAEGARRRLPPRPPALLAPLAPPGRHPARPPRDRAGDPRLLLRARLRPDRHPAAHRRDRRAQRAVLHRVLRRGLRVPGPDGPAVRGSARRGARKNLHVRPHLPGGEEQDAPASHRVLDDRAGGRVQRLRRQHATAGGVRRLPRAALPGAARAR
ncbi:MAG: Asparaginyl-tRNA synthetase, partial [uncultured Gemmatimonadaceae bacterium]